MLSLFLQYIVSAALITVAGTMLVRSGEAIANRFQLGHVWLGSLLIAAATSFPEVITSYGAVKIQAYDMALSNIYGSVLFNLAILGLMVLFLKNWHVEQIGKSIKLAVFFCAALILATLLGMLVPGRWTLAAMGPVTWLILLAYIFYVKSTFKNDTTEDAVSNEDQAPLIKHIIIYVIAVALIIVAGLYCVRITDRLMFITGWGERFMGIVFLAFATSLPELVTTWHATRMRSLSLLLGIIWGSNLFNIVILTVCDITAGSQRFLELVSSQNLLTGISSIIFVLLAPFLLAKGLESRYLRLKTSGLLVILTYILIIFLIYTRSQSA